MGTTMNDKLLRVPEVADRLGVTPSRLYDLVRTGALPVVRIGRQLRVHPKQLEEWLAGGGVGLRGGWRREPR